jgi:uncharacterized lipoprotein NlpE involved in copper resistance
MKKLLITVVLLILTTLACTKKNEPSNPVGNNNFKTYSSMDTIFSMLEVKPKVVIFDAAVGASFYGNSGTRYIFRKNSFIDATGAVVSGNVQVEVSEYLKKGDMIFSGLLPISNGEPLVSGGEIYVKASKNGNELFLRKDSTFQAKIPQFGSKDSVMSLFSSSITGGTSTNKVNWQKKDTSNFNAGIVYKGDTISIFSDSMKYCNADRFLSNPHYQDFKVSVAASGVTIDINSLSAYALYDSYKGLMLLSPSSAGVFEGTHIPDIPIHFVSFGLINGHFYGGVVGVTPKTGSTYTITLTEVNPDDFKAQINGLY